MTVACVVVLPIGLAQGGAALLKPRSIALGGAIGILSSAIPYTFEMEALRRIATGVFGVLMSLEPGVAALAGFVLLGQSLSGREAVGIGLVVAASIGASRRARADRDRRLTTQSSIVVPTVLSTNAAGKRVARRWTAFQPVQCAGTRTAGASSASASTVGSMIDSNIGPLR